MITQYDVDSYLKIEQAIGQKLPEYKVPKNKVMSYHEKVQESIRISDFEYKKLIQKNNKKKKKKIKF